MAPLITREEALELGELSAPADIEALVERAWQARTERFADSTDMCSLVNAKSGGCAQDCGFCAQSRYAEAETPLHAINHWVDVDNASTLGVGLFDAISLTVLTALIAALWRAAATPTRGAIR